MFNIDSYMHHLQDFTGVMFKKKDYMFVIENVSHHQMSNFSHFYLINLHYQRIG